MRKALPLGSVRQGALRGFELEVNTLILPDSAMLTAKQEIDKLRQLSKSNIISAEVRRYLQDVVVFLRLERGVAGGVSPHATSQFEMLAK